MTNINVVTMSGNLTKDVEIRNNIAKISIDVNRSAKDQSGNWTELVSYFDWVNFLRQDANIQNLQQKLVKGTPVTLTGEARQNKWQDINGNNQYSVNFVVKNMEIHIKPQPAPQQNSYGSYQSTSQPQAPQYQQKYAPQQYQQPVQQRQPVQAQPQAQPQQGGPENFVSSTFDDSDIPF